MGKSSTVKKADRAIQKAKETTTRTTLDAAATRRAALVEVDLGRRCAMAGAVAWVTLAFVASILYLDLAAFSDPVRFIAFFSFLPAFGPALAGLAVGGVAFMGKRGKLLGGHLLELHNQVMIAGLVVSVLVLILALGNQLKLFSVNLGLFVFALGTAGISLGMLGFLLTWHGWSPRKIVATLCAVLPSLMFIATVANPPNLGLLVVWQYMMGGALYMAAGVIFIVAMTSTSGAEREIVKGAHERIAIESAKLKARRKEVEAAVASNAERAGELEAEADTLEEKTRKAESILGQAAAAREEAEARLVNAVKAEDAATTRLAEVESRAEAAAVREKELTAIEAARKERESMIFELDKSLEKEKAALEAERRKIESGRAAAAAELAHAKREREAARATLEAAEARARETEALRAKAEESRRQLEVHAQLKGAEATQAETERVRALEQLERSLQDERARLTEARRAAEEARMKAQAMERGIAEREHSLAERSKELDTLENAQADALAKMASERAELDAMRRQAEGGLAEARERQKMFSESVMQMKDRETRAAAAADAAKTRERLLAERQARLKELESSLEARNRQIAAERQAVAKEREKLRAQSMQSEQVQSELSERERVILQLEKHPEMAAGIASMLQEELRAEVDRAEAVAAPPPPVRAAAATGSPVRDTTATGEKRLKLGNDRLDELVGGGLPAGSSALVVGPAFCGKELIPLGFLAAGLREGTPGIIVTTIKSPAELLDELELLSPDAARRARDLLRWVDASGKGARGGLPRSAVIDVDSPADFAKIREAISAHWKGLGEAHRNFHFAYISLTESLRHAEPTVARTFIQKMVSAVKNVGGGAIFVAESGVHTSEEVESLVSMMQGVVRCQEERTGTVLRVQGLAGTRPHGWVQYHHSPKGLSIGSFELEKIR